MSGRSLRAGIIKTGDSIQRATRRNTVLYKTENGFQQARQVQKRHTLDIMPVECPPPKRKRKNSPLKKQEATRPQSKQNENISSIADKPQKEDVRTKRLEIEINKLTVGTLKEVVGYPPMKKWKREPRMASLNAIAKVNAVLHSFQRAENKHAPSNSAKGVNILRVEGTCLREGGKADKEVDGARVEAAKDIINDEYVTEGKDTSSREVLSIKEIKDIETDNCAKKEKDTTINIEHIRVSETIKDDIYSAEATKRCEVLSIKEIKNIETDNYSSEEKETLAIDVVKCIENDYCTTKDDKLSMGGINVIAGECVENDNCTTKGDTQSMGAIIINEIVSESIENDNCATKEDTFSSDDMDVILSECIEKDNCTTKEKDILSMNDINAISSESVENDSCVTKEENGVNITKSKNIKMDMKIQTTDVVKTSNVIGNDNGITKKKDVVHVNVHTYKTAQRDNCTAKSKHVMKEMAPVKIRPLNEGCKETSKSNKVKKAERRQGPIVGKGSSKGILKEERSINKNVQTCSSNKVPITSQPKEQEICPNHQQHRSKVDSKIEVVIPACNENISEISDSESVPYDMSSPESSKELDDENVNKGIKMSDQSVQTDTNDKSVQTDTKHLPNIKNKRICTCKIQSESTPAILHYNPGSQENIAKAFCVKSTVLAHTNNHTLAVPITKRHVLKEKENEYRKARITNNISTLLDACINNTLLQNNVTCAKLVYLANYKEKSVILNTPNIDWKKDRKPTKTVENPPLQVPQVKFGSVPDEKSNGVDKDISKDTPVVVTKQKVKSPLGPKKKCTNGWQFEGEPMEEPYTLGSQIITRRHYESICRNNEVLQIHDAVMLKSGLGKQGTDYVARISMFWEDLAGPHAGDMMMSIYWYYNPEQTNFNFPDTSKMEVYASRHRDDNSVACIVEKCYVISFTQFCRFQAQKMLLKEKCKKKPKVVPEDKNIRSRFLPSPDVDESIVYFCRYGYEYRCGKLIKGL